MKGEYKVNTNCPSCKKRISVYASTTNGTCPECGRNIPALRVFVSHTDKLSDKMSSVNVYREPERNRSVSPREKETLKYEKIKRSNSRLGSIVISKHYTEREYIIMDRFGKHGHKVFRCLPVIDSDSRTKTDRFVNSLVEGKLVVFNKEELIYDYTIDKVICQVPEKIYERLKQSYKNYLASSPEKESTERHNVAPHDGLRNGNAWEGIAAVTGKIKVFRG